MISTVKAFEDISNWSKFKNILTLPVPIPAEEKKLSEIFISIQLPEMHGTERVKKRDQGQLCKSKSQNNEFMFCISDSC